MYFVPLFGAERKEKESAIRILSNFWNKRKLHAAIVSPQKGSIEATHSGVYSDKS
jgi:hypothetical protein